MSNLAFSENHSAARRARRVVGRPMLSVVAPPTPVRTPAPGSPRTIERKKGWSLLLGAAAIVLLHVGVVFYLMHRPTDAVTAPIPPPVSVELVQPQIVQPPKPLPQKKQAPPPRLPSPPRTPHIERPPPATTPATPITPQAPVQPPPTPAAPVLVPVTSAVGYAGYLNNPAPDYPQFAQDQSWEGHIVLHVHVLADGHPDTMLVKISSHRKILDDAAQHAVQRWLFSPAKRGETAVEGWVDVPIDFKLST
jgi:periplasmic protein TonB